MNIRILGILIIALSALAACNKDSVGAADLGSRETNNGASTEGEADLALPQRVDPLAATPNFDLDFSKDETVPGVTSVEGLGEQEAWGRWSTSNSVVLNLAANVKPRLKLTVWGMAYGPNAGKPVLVTIGNETKEFTFTKPDVNETFELTFERAEGNRIVFVIPEPSSPGVSDPRTLGIGFTGIKVEY